MLGRFILKRSAFAVVLLFILSFVTFVLQRLAPTDPARAILGQQAPQEAVDKLRHELWLDRPIPVQYFHYIGGVVRGDFGTSIKTKSAVSDNLVKFLPASLELIFVGVLFAIVGGLLIGLLSARPGLLGAAVRFVITAGAAIPGFLVALLAILLFYRELGWLPAAGRVSARDAPTGPTRFMLVDSVLHWRWDVFFDAWKHLLLPALCLATGPSVAVGRMLRSAVIGTMGQDYVRTARAKGLSEFKVMWKHVLRNCMNSTLAMIAIQCGAMFAGILAIESIFTWPGLGMWVSSSVGDGDYPVVLSVTLITSAIYIVANTAGDIVQTIADPRIART